MIELPEPTYHESGATDYHGNLLAYTADQLRTYGDQRAAEAREQMREECERLRAALEEFVSIVGTAAGFETAMTESDDVFTEFLNKQQARVDGALANANALLDAARANP